MKTNQIIGLSFLAFIFICSALLANWQINWLNQASKTQLLSAQQDMALDATRLIEQSNIELDSILSNPKQYASIVVDHTQILMNLNGNTELNALTRQSNWQSIIQDLPTAASLGYRTVSNTLQRNLPDSIFYIVHDEKNSKSTEVLVDLFKLDFAKFSQLVMSQFDSTSYHYRWLINENVTAQSDSLTTSQSADLDIPIIFYLKESKRFRNESDNNHFNNDTKASSNRNIFWFYESILRSFKLKEDNFDHAKKPSFLVKTNELSIKVYNLDQSLNQSINTQKLILTILSLSILTLLTVTAFFLFYAMHRSQNQRKLEQEFIATVNHELRTPLTVIQSAADNLSEGFVNKPESIKRYGHEIKTQSQRLNRMIESTLLYSGMPSQSKPNYETIYTQAFLEEVLSPLIQLAKNSQFVLNSQFINLPDQFQMDINALRMIIENLIMNSIIHGKCDDSNNKICLKLEVTDDNSLYIIISDNGSGIAKKEQKKIFNAFVRGKRSEQQQHAGSGLGLNLIKRIVTILSGQIALESPYLDEHNQFLQGAKFTIVLPLNKHEYNEQHK